MADHGAVPSRLANRSEATLIPLRFRLCMVASEVLGAHKNGGIGTATTHLALFFARSGHDVTLIYTGTNPIDYADPWIRRCRSASIEIRHIDTRNAEIYPIWMRESCILYDYLRCFDYDAILFQDWEGSAFCSVVAKKAGLSFANTTLVIIAHGPTAWLLDANRSYNLSQQRLAQLYMERVAFHYADHVVCPSHHMMNWLREHGQPMSGRVSVIPLYLWSSDEEEALSGPPLSIDRVKTIAYFGRLETRKGVDLFLDAILSDALAAVPFRIVFVGKPASHTPEQILSTIRARRPQLEMNVSFETDLDSDQAQRFLRENGCLAVIPSLVDNAPCVISECLRRGIPFISTTTGGIPELIVEVDRARVLVRPSAGALAERLAAAANASFDPAQPAYTERAVAEQWTAWLRDLVPTEAESRARPALPLDNCAERLTVVVTHHNRPKLLVQMLESLAIQTCTDFNVIVVDDGSTLTEARNVLETIEHRSWPFRLQVLREPNRYVGAARNVGIRATGADRIIVLDDDNVAFPTLVETLDHAMSATGADIVTCQMSVFRDPEQAPDPAQLAAAERWTFLGDAVELGLSINCFGDATGIYRRSLFDEVGYFHEWRGLGYEDWHFHARAALAQAKIVSLPVPLFWYRRVATGMLMSTSRFDNYQIIRDLYREALPPTLRHLIDLSIRNEFSE